MDKPIAALEVTARRPDTFDSIVHIIVSPGNPNPDIDRVRDHHGGKWLRHLGESARELQDRAIAAARLTTKGMPRLIAEEHHARIERRLMVLERVQAPRMRVVVQHADVTIERACARNGLAPDGRPDLKAIVRK